MITCTITIDEQGTSNISFRAKADKTEFLQFIGLIEQAKFETLSVLPSGKDDVTVMGPPEKPQ